MKSSRKLIVILVCLIIGTMSYPLIKTYKKGDISDVKIVIGRSDYFTKKEIEVAMEAVFDDFTENRRGDKLLELEYDQFFSLKTLLNSGRTDLVNNVPSKSCTIETDIMENYMRKKSKIRTGPKKGLNYSPNYLMDDWSYLLKKDNNNNTWKVIDQGI